VREALNLAFRKFEEFGSVRQVVMWLCDEGIKMPTVVYGTKGRMLEWRSPRYNTIHRLLTNPIYAGAYVFGRTGSSVRIHAGRKLIRRNIAREREAWDVLIYDHHESYLSWEEYERNQRIISGNANMKGEMVPGSVRNGGGLLVGLLRCGHCGRKLKVQHNGLRGVARYMCVDAAINHGQRTTCIAFGNMRVDAAVSEEVLRVIAPLGLNAALQAITDRTQTGAEKLKQIELSLEQVRYEAARAHRQYDSVDPENRLVAGDLERRWNERLTELAGLKEDMRVARENLPAAMTETERKEILSLATDLARLWKHPGASAVTRKRILRAVLEEIIVTVEPQLLRLKLHWKGGDHTALEVVKNRSGQHRWKTSEVTEQLICDLARLLPDGSIASLLNRLGIRTAKSHTWTQQRVCAFRNDHNIALYRDGERAERGELILHEAASHLGVSKMTIVRLIKDGVLPAKQACVGAPYVIRQADLSLPGVRDATENGRAVTSDPRQGIFDYQ
jgi:excisionase family DNA binding protein